MKTLHSFHWKWAACFLTAAFTLPGPAWAQAQEFRLPNGLRIIVKEDHRAPVVVAQVWYKAGSMDEEEAVSGVAHVLEHMMFKGTHNVGPGEFSKLIATAGGRDNAYTTRDSTVYFQQLEKSKLPLAFRLEADRMQNLALSAKEFAKEIRVVIEERRLSTEDKPQSLVYEQTMATAFREHPYRRPVIGWMDDLKQMSVQDTRQWYRNWYAPNNALLVVVGDVKPLEVKQWAKRYFGAVPAHTVPARKQRSEPAQRGVRSVTVKAPAKLPYALLAYRAPELRDAHNDWEPYALEILAGVLGAGDSARLNKILVRDKRVAMDVGAGYDGIARGPGMFLIEGTSSEGRSTDDLVRAVQEVVRSIQQQGITQQELRRIKAQVVASQVYERDSIFYQAMKIGEMEIAGLSHRDLDIRLDKLKLVTVQQVQEVANKYLVEENLTIGLLDPQPLEGNPVERPPLTDHIR
jgi:zinc protease